MAARKKAARKPATKKAAAKRAPSKRAPAKKATRKTTRKTTGKAGSKRGRGVDWEGVRRLVLAFPRVDEGTSYGTPAFRAAKKLFVRLREDGETLVVKVPEELRDALLDADGERVFFTTDHYRGYAMVLVALPRVHEGDLRQVLEEGWRELAPKRALAEWDEGSA